MAKNSDAWLRAQGFKVLRFWNNEIMNNLEGVLVNIMAAVNEAPLSPSPSPARGEG
jgi:very-short-patch-repair endonuclease